MENSWKLVFTINGLFTKCDHWLQLESSKSFINFKSPFNCLKLFVSHTDYCFLLTHYYLVSNLPSLWSHSHRKPLAIMMLMLLSIFHKNEFQFIFIVLSSPSPLHSFYKASNGCEIKLILWLNFTVFIIIYLYFLLSMKIFGNLITRIDFSTRQLINWI